MSVLYRYRWRLGSLALRGRWVRLVLVLRVLRGRLVLRVPRRLFLALRGRQGLLDLLGRRVRRVRLVLLAVLVRPVRLVPILLCLVRRVLLVPRVRRVLQVRLVLTRSCRALLALQALLDLPGRRVPLVLQVRPGLGERGLPWRSISVQLRCGTKHSPSPTRQ